MKQNLLNKLWLRVGMIVAVMTTALAGTALAETTYKLQQVTSVEEGGLYVFEQGGYVMSNECSSSALQTTNSYNTTGLSGTETYVWTLESATGGFYMKNVSLTNYPYLYNTSKTNVSFGNSGSSVWAFKFQDDNTVLIQNKSNSDRFLGYTSSTSYAYKAYATSNLSSYPHAIVVYQLVEEGGSGDTSVSTSVTIDASGITNTDVYAGTAAGSLSATVVAGETTLSGATVTWSGNNDAVATIDASTGVVTLVAAGTVTFTAEYAGVDGTYKPSSKTYEMTVTNSDPNVPGTETNPYTVAQARAAIDAGTGITGVYATGIVSKIVTAYNSQYGNISYNISEDGTEEADQLQAYRGFSYNGDWFSSANDIKVGDVVVVYGNLRRYGSTYEFDSGNQLVSLDRPVVTTPSITVDPATVNAPYTGTTGTINVTYDNVYPNVGVDTEWYTDATCATTTEAPSWIEILYDTENNVTYTIQENDGSEARTAYMKIWSYSAPEVKEYSEVITFSQAAYVVGYATLPFWWSGGKADIESTAGLSQEGLGDDYSISPKLKFDSTGDWLLLQFNERPSKLSFEIKGNPSSGVWAGTFTVQTSEDGVTYTDLKSYTELTSAVKSEPFDNLGENVRYIKWVYTEKVSGNVALGNIAVDTYSVDPPAISISPITVNVDAVATEGTLDIRLDNITISDKDQFGVKYLTSSLESTTKPEWLDVVVAEQDPSVGEGYVVSYTVQDNDGKARSAYFQVYGLDDDGSTEALSQVVTIEQAAYVAPEAPNVTWDLSIASYSASSEDQVTWSSDYATMTLDKGSSSTKANNYLGGDVNNRTSSRFYNGNTLTIAPALGYKITSIEFVATSENYASVLKNSDWTNAEVAVSSTTVTVTPTDGSVEVSAVIGGTCGFTSVKVYYETLADFAPVWSALPTPTITAGDAYEFYPSDYVAGLPAPSITLETTAPSDTYDYDNGYFLFASDTAGEYTFTFTATNTEGSASATLTITVEDAPLPVASIDLGETTISAPYEGLDGTIDVTYNNLTDVLAEVQFVEADGTTTATYSWVAANIDTNKNIEYIIEENTSTDARTAYMKVYAVGNEGDAYSELITITQAGYVVDYATLPFVWTGGTKEDLLAENGVTAHDLGKNYADSNAPYLVKLDGTGDYIQVQTDCQPVLVSLDVKMLGGSATSTITVQESADGENFTDVEDLAIEGAQNDVLYLQTANAFDAATRYVRLYFTKGSNVGVGGITIEKEFEEIATVGAAGYATYVTKHNVAFPADVAYIGAVNGNVVSMTAVTAAPKGTALVLKGEGTYNLSPAHAGDLADVSGNELKASETEVVADGTQYILAKPANEPVGFYQATGTIPAGKAYLVVPSSSVKAFYFSFDDDATGLSNMSDMSDQSDIIFNIAGQRIQKMQKGINIVNGKKVAIK